MLLRLLFSVIVLVSLGQCSSSSETTTAPTTSTTSPPPAAPAVAQAEPNAIVQQLLQPQGELPFPVYQKFGEIDTLFRQRDGRVYVINFWATWCKPCVEELPYFEQLATEMADQPVDVIMVSLDFKRDIPTKLRDFVQQRPLRLPVLALADSDYNSWIDRVDPSWGGAIPITVIYKNDQWGFFEDQFPDYASLAAAVRKML